jgi:hypothetical protein
MTKFPSWDFWKFMTIDVTDRGRNFQSTVSIYDWADLVRTDIRNKKFDLDCNKWCRENFWEADEAAAISFGRDPGKIKQHLSEHGYLGADEDNEEECADHEKLVEAINERQRLIEEAQAKEMLTKDFFRPGMYIDWGKRLGFQVPPEVEKWLSNVERERRGEGKISGRFAGMFIENDSTAIDDNPSPDKVAKPKKNLGSQQVRLDNNLRKIILALLKKTALDKANPKKLAGELEEILDELAVEHSDKGLQLSSETILERLNEARDRILD